ncbi:MAG: hypothetical protein QG622_2918 [Actinomycetota bacterium]|nr:hypothetical protein [Actinomycetota bacterium]
MASSASSTLADDGTASSPAGLPATGGAHTPDPAAAARAGPSTRSPTPAAATATTSPSGARNCSPGRTVPDPTFGADGARNRASRSCGNAVTRPADPLPTRTTGPVEATNPRAPSRAPVHDRVTGNDNPATTTATATTTANPRPDT